jgi:hypothetical protein
MPFENATAEFQSHEILPIFLLTASPYTVIKLLDIGFGSLIDVYWGREHVHSIRSLGLLYTNQGKLGEAKKMYRRTPEAGTSRNWIPSRNRQPSRNWPPQETEPPSRYYPIVSWASESDF